LANACNWPIDDNVIIGRMEKEARRQAGEEVGRARAAADNEEMGTVSGAPEAPPPSRICRKRQMRQ